MIEFKNLQCDIPAGIAIFFIAIPPFLGISLASGSPLYSGLIASILGGILVAPLSEARQRDLLSLYSADNKHCGAIEGTCADVKLDLLTGLLEEIQPAVKRVCA